MGEQEVNKVSQIIQEALKMSDILGYKKTLDILKNLQKVNKFPLDLQKFIVITTLDYYGLKWDYIIQRKAPVYEDERIYALSIISLMLAKYCKYSLDDIAGVLKKKTRQNINYYLNRINNLSDKNENDVKLKAALVKIESQIKVFIEEYPI